MTDESRQPTAPIPAVPEASAVSADAGARQSADSASTPKRSAARPGSGAAAGRARKASARDERLMHAGRERRSKRQTRRRRQQTALTIAGGVVLALMVIGFGAYLWSTTISDAPKDVSGGEHDGGFISRALAKSRSDDNSVKEMAQREPELTPRLARWHNLQIHVPVKPEKLTEVGFHQAARTYAAHLDAYPKKAETEKIRKSKTTGDHPVEGTGASAMLRGYYIPMWRNRPGAPDSAIDVGANPGTDVYAPVDGEVVKVRHYRLYGRLNDWEMHIRPDGAPEMDLVVIHIANPTVEIGQRVEGGKTKIAEVRKISGIISSQLAEFTHGGGNHVHIQLNDARRSDYKGLSLRDDAGLEPYPGPTK